MHVMKYESCLADIEAQILHLMEGSIVIGLLTRNAVNNSQF